MNKTVLNVIGLAFCLLLIGCERGGGAGESAAPEQFTGKVVFINYWAEWCAPCREEIPALNQFQERHAGDVQVLGVNFDGVQGEELRRQEAALGVAFPTLETDPRPDLGVPPPQGLPETLVLDKRGRLAQRLTGPQELEDLEQVLEEVRSTQEGAR